MPHHYFRDARNHRFKAGEQTQEYLREYGGYRTAAALSPYRGSLPGEHRGYGGDFPVENVPSVSLNTAPRPDTAEVTRVADLYDPSFYRRR